MQFAELQAEVILKKHYSTFREEGIAFETFEDGQYNIPNKALSSSRVLSNRIGDKRAFRGFWVSKIFLSLLIGISQMELCEFHFRAFYQYETF